MTFLGQSLRPCLDSLGKLCFCAGKLIADLLGRPREIIHEKGNLSTSTLRVMKNVLDLRCQWTSLKPSSEFLEPDSALVAIKRLIRNQHAKSKKAAAADASDDEEMESEDDVKLPAAIESMKDDPQALSALGGMVWHLGQLNLDAELCPIGNFDIYDPMRSGKCLCLDGQSLAHIEVLQNSMGTDDGTLEKLLNRCITPFGAFVPYPRLSTSL